MANPNHVERLKEGIASWINGGTRLLPPIPIVIGFVVCGGLFALVIAGLFVFVDYARSVSLPPPTVSPARFVYLVMIGTRTGMSFVLLVAALWVILSKRYGPTDRHWAYGIIGMIVGYWLGKQVGP
jgi:hypothetical protein